MLDVKLLISCVSIQLKQLQKKDGFSFLSQFDATRKLDATNDTAPQTSEKSPFNFLSYIAEKQKYLQTVYKEAQECKNTFSNLNCKVGASFLHRFQFFSIAITARVS